MRALILAVFCTILLQTGFSQAAKSNLSMSDAIQKEWRDYNPKSLGQLQWIPGTSTFSYVANKKIVRVQAQNQAVDTLDFLSIIHTKWAEFGEDSLKGIPPITWMDANNVHFHTATGFYNLQTTKGTVTRLAQIPENAENIDVLEKKNHIAYTEDNALFVVANGVNQLVARSEADGIVIGKSVHRDEFGIHNGTFWSPDGQKLAFYRMDERMVTKYPIYILDSMPAVSKEIRYPFAGAASHHVSVGVFDVKTGKTIYLKTGEPLEQYLTNVAWTPDGKYVLIAVLQRNQELMRLNMYDAQTGKFEATILEEISDTWVEPEHPALFVPENENFFVWQSERDGFNHLYLYDISGTLLRQLSKGQFPVTQVLGFDKNGRTIFWEAADETGMDRHQYKTDINTGVQTKLTSEPGTHIFFVNESGEFAVDHLQSTTIPRRYSIVNLKKPNTSTTHFEAANPYENVNLGLTKLETVASPGGFPLNARLILPPNFDPTKKYPAIQYVYNGPHVQLNRNTWMAAANLWMHRMASEGFIVFTIDGRGSDNRGHAFESAIHRRLAVCEVEDQLAGLAYLKSQPYVDPARVGVYGWSYGGYMTASLLTRPEAKGAFACGVSGGAVTDWRMYEIMYTERYMDNPAENAEGYNTSSVFPYIDNLNVPMLMIHGTSDDVVLWQHTLRYVREAVRKGKQLDYFPYPEHLHNVRGGDRTHLFEKIEAYFKLHLMPK